LDTHSHFVVLPKPDGYFAFVYRGKMCVASLAIVSCAKSFPWSAPVTLQAVPRAFRSIAQIGVPGHPPGWVEWGVGVPRALGRTITGI
jgi:hypothetical protein